MIERFSLVHRERVRWAEVDPQGIVFNANYLAYFDIGVTEYWRSVGLRYPDDLVSRGSDLYAVRAVVEFHRSAVYDDWIDICARVARMGRSSLRFEMAVMRGDERLASGELVYVNADPGTKKSIPLPEAIRALVRAYEKEPPEEQEGGSGA